MYRKALQFFAVVGLGVFAVMWNLDISLFVEDEGLYAAVIDRAVIHESPFHLDLHGQRYLNKPPLFFWMESLASTYLEPVVGSIEVAWRIPASLFSLGTLLLTYHLGEILVSPLAGFWAGVVVATTYLFYWYGRRGVAVAVAVYSAHDRLEWLAFMADCCFAAASGIAISRSPRGRLDVGYHWIRVAGHGCRGISTCDVSGNESLAASSS